MAARPDMQIAQEMLAFFLSQNEPPARPSGAASAAWRGAANDAVRIRLGLLLSESGRAREALELLRPYASRDDPDLLNAYGIALADNGDGRPRSASSSASSPRPNNARAHQNLGIVALRAGDAPPRRAASSSAPSPSTPSCPSP